MEITSPDSSQIFAGMWESMPPEMLNNINLIFTLMKWLLIIIMIYFGVGIILKIKPLFFSGSKKKKKK